MRPNHGIDSLPALARSGAQTDKANYYSCLFLLCERCLRIDGHGWGSSFWLPQTVDMDIRDAGGKGLLRRTGLVGTTAAVYSSLCGLEAGRERESFVLAYFFPEMVEKNKSKIRLAEALKTLRQKRRYNVNVGVATVVA